MIKEKELREMRPQIRYPDGQNINLNAVRSALQEDANANGIPIAFEMDQVKFGGLIGGGIEDCLVVYHPEHKKDYFNIAVRVKHQGNYAFVSVNDFGTSKQIKKEDVANAYKQDRQGKKMSYKVGSMVGQAIFSIGKNKQKLEEEQNWYSMVIDLFDEIIS